MSSRKLTSDKNKAGFTLIELLVVVAIIGLLSAVVLTSISTARDQARYANVIQQMDAIGKAALTYEVRTGEWAEDVNRGETPDFVPKYLNQWPEPECGVYDYENWSGRGGPEEESDPDIRVSIREVPGGPYWFCVVHERMSDCHTNNNVFTNEEVGEEFSSIHTVNTIKCN